MKKVLYIFLVVITSFYCLTACVQITVNPKEEKTPVEESKSESSNNAAPIKVTFEELIRNPGKYNDKLIEINCYVSSTKDYLSFQGVRISTEWHITRDYERDNRILKENRYLTWSVMPVDTWQYTQYDTWLTAGDSVAIVGYFRFRQSGDNPDWYDGIESEGDYGKIFATEITVNDNESSNKADKSKHSIEKDEDTCLEAGCDNIPINLSSYCGEHKCAKSGCISSKYSMSDFCLMHKCDSVGCDNARNDDGYYCGEHTCAERGCSQDRESFSNYCSFHECNEIGCENRKNGYGYYCSEHECAKSGCSNKKSSFSDYCLSHED